MKQKVQFLRNAGNALTDKAAAKAKLIETIGKRQNAGEPIVCTYNYTENETSKIGVLLAVAVGDGKNYSIFEPSTEVSDSITTAIDSEIQKLDVAAIGGTGKMITTVSETDGKVSAIAVDASATNISSKAIASGDDTIAITSTTVQGAIAELAKEVKTAQTTTTTTVKGLDYSDSAVANQYVSTVSQSGGLIKVGRVALPVSSVSDTSVANQFVTGISLENGAVKAARSGVTASQVTRTATTNVKATTVEAALEELATASTTTATNSKITISTDATTEGYLKTYTVKQGTTTVGTIDIPKDLVVTSGSVVYGTWSDTTFTEGAGADTALKLVIANQTKPVYINTKSLVDIYTEGSGISVASNAISVKLADTQDGNAALETTNGLKVSAVKTSSSFGDSANYPSIDGVTFTPVTKEMELDTALANVDKNAATLADEVVKNEQVNAAALTALNNAAGFDENGNYDKVTDASYIADATSVKDATKKLDAAIKAVADAEVNVAGGSAISVTTADDSKTKTIAVKYDTDSLAVDESGNLYVAVVDGGTY